MPPYDVDVIFSLLVHSLKKIFRCCMQQSVFMMLPADRKGYGSTGEYFPLELMVTIMFIFQVRRGKMKHCFREFVTRQSRRRIFVVGRENFLRMNETNGKP